MLPLMSIQFPPNIKLFCQNLVPLHGEPGFVPNFFEECILTGDEYSKPLNPHFDILGYKSTFFIINASRKITLTLTVLVLAPICILIGS